MNDALVSIQNYYKAFSTLDVDACVPFFSLPCMFIGLHGSFAVANREDFGRVLGPAIEALKSQDYQRSEFIEPQPTALTENAVLVRGVAVRYRASGTELQRTAVSYVVHQNGAAWKIAVCIAAQ
jgi:uncharacterized NTF2-like protein DUF6841